MADANEEARVVAFLKERCPELFSCTDAELLAKTKEALWQLEIALRAMRDRKMDPVWWKPEKLLEEVEWINEEYGWEGVGR